ncbi:MAG: cation:proton antiporter [Planctomycetes bacterium]|nr:cation:proton antiporter [Planctomycetota bacterium]
MHDPHEFLQALTLVLCVAAVTTVLFQRLRQPVVLGYILAGLIVGPHVPIPLVADPAIIRTLSELGVILLMFSLGLGFSLRNLLQVVPTAGLTAVVECSIMFWVGFVAGRAFGWTTHESLFVGALISISSTTIIAKAFEERGITGRLRELVVGILVVEDLIAVVLMAALTAISAGDGVSADVLARSSARLVVFLVCLVAGGMLVVPRAVRVLHRLGRAETTVVASVGLCFAIALLTQQMGYPVALGAFLAGSLVAESGEEREIRRLIQPVRDVFAAVFFVSVGMQIDPALVARHGAAVAVLTVVVIVGKVASVSAGAFLTGNGTRTSIQAGMSLAQIGEFSFIIAALGISLGATGDFLYPVAVAVSAVTTLTTPGLIRGSGPVAAFVDQRLPQPLQTFASLYGSWVERLRASPRRGTAGAAVRRLAALLALDAVLLAGLVIGAAVFSDRAAGFVVGRLEVTGAVSRALVLAGTAALASPLCVGIVRIARRLGVTLADAAFPAFREGRLDSAAAPRRALVVTLQLAVLLLVGLPLLALTQPFLPGVPGVLLLVLLLSAFGFAFWRSAANLQGHVRAGAEMIVEVLAAQARRGGATPGTGTLAQVRHLLPGLGEPVPVRLDARSAAVGRTLVALNLRGFTGATVLAITRGEEGILVPTGQEVLRSGDVLAVAGSQEAVGAARALLLNTIPPAQAGRDAPTSGPAAPSPPP